MNQQRRHTSETASAMVVAIAIVILTAGIVGVIVQAGIGNSARSKSQLQKAHIAWGADSAAAKIRLALNGKLMSEADQFQLSAADMTALIDQPADEVVLDHATAPPEVPAAFRTMTVPAGYDAVGFKPALGVTMRQRLTQSSFGYWQIYRLQEPDYVHRMALRVWVRTWIGNGQAASATEAPVSRIRVAEFRPRYFTDYQMVINGPLALNDDLSLDGPSHFNGYYVGPDEAASVPGARVNCDSAPSGGVTPRLSTSMAAAPPSSGCDRRGNQPPLAFTNIEDTFRRMRASCGTRVRCYNGAGPWTITVSGNTASVSGGGGPPSFDVRTFQAVLFEGDVSVRASTNRRFTIAARPRNNDPGEGNIRILPSTSTVGANRSTGNGPGDLAPSVGLFARGNIIMEGPVSPGDPCTRAVDAALITQTGSVRLDPYRTGQLAMNPDWRCGHIRFNGPIAGQRAPVLKWTWDTGGWFGFQRNPLFPTFTSNWYSRDGEMRMRYRDNPPPFAPSDGNWARVGWKPANVDCLQGPPVMTAARAADCM